MPVRSILLVLALTALLVASEILEAGAGAALPILLAGGITACFLVALGLLQSERAHEPAREPFGADPALR